jgi:flagellar basal-body rod protein FlgB
MDRLDRFFGLQGEALALRSERLQILASNIANAATPGYRARDLDFAAELARASETPAPLRTHPRHVLPADPDGARLLWRQPVQPSLDGNTVELATEQLAFADTALRYRATLSVLDSRISSLKAAMRVD